MLKVQCSHVYIFTLSIGLTLGGCSSITQKAAPVENSTQGVVPPALHSSFVTQVDSNSAAIEKKRERTHVFKPGETLFRISKNNGLNYLDVAAWNNLLDHNISVGQIVHLLPPDSLGLIPQRALSENEPIRERVKKASQENLQQPYSGRASDRLPTPVHGSLGINNNTPLTKKLAGLPTTTTVQAKNWPSSVATPKHPEHITPGWAADEEEISWLWPTDGQVIRNYSDNSKGIDISGRIGQPVLATGTGKVVYSGRGLRGYGKLIIIKHNESFLSTYAHNSQLLVKEGQLVKQGQKIAAMGNSDADQVKLHFEIRRLGKPVNPMPYLNKRF